MISNTTLIPCMEKVALDESHTVLNNCWTYKFTTLNKRYKEMQNTMQNRRLVDGARL